MNAPVSLPTPTQIQGPDGPLPAAFSLEVVRLMFAAVVEDNDTVTDPERLARCDAAYESLMSFVPGEPVEAMIAAQAVASHTAAMENFRRAMMQYQSDDTRIRLRSNAAVLMRSLHSSLRALERHRGWAAGKQIFRD